MSKLFFLLGFSYLSNKIKFTLLRYKLFLTKGVIIDKTVKLYFTDENFIISKKVAIGPYNVIYAINSSHSKICGKLIVGEGTSIGEFNNIRAAGGEIKIGSDCLISQYVTIVSSNHNIALNQKINLQGWDEKKTGVTIGNDVWIGANSTILPGVVVGNGCIIAAGTVVTKNIPDNAIVMGIPGKIKGYRN
jgi:carbonic anhydrase/acetyltransferase-like protein (isoleucine patch superfamily)